MRHFAGVQHHFVDGGADTFLAILLTHLGLQQKAFLGDVVAFQHVVNELLPVIDSLDRALEVADKANPELAPMVEGIELTLKSMLDVVRKFGVEVIADTNVPLDPNVHQAIAMVESEDVAAGNVLSVMQKGYTLNGRTIRAAMVTVAKAK